MKSRHGHYRGRYGMSLRIRNGKWHYRFKVAGKSYPGSTGLEATARYRKAAESIEAKAWQEVKAGRSAPSRIEAIEFTVAADQFLTWCEGHAGKPNTWRRVRGSFTSLRLYYQG